MQLHSITSLPSEKQTDFQVEPESLKCELACISFYKRRENESLGYFIEVENRQIKCDCVLCRQYRELLIIRLFILLQKSVNTEQHTWERSREIWAA